MVSWLPSPILAFGSALTALGAAKRHILQAVHGAAWPLSKARKCLEALHHGFGYLPISDVNPMKEQRVGRHAAHCHRLQFLLTKVKIKSEIGFDSR